MALTATVHTFEIALSDVDRNVHETLELTRNEGRLYVTIGGTTLEAPLARASLSDP